jgi:hypothetical protein
MEIFDAAIAFFYFDDSKFVRGCRLTGQGPDVWFENHPVDIGH